MKYLYITLMLFIIAIGYCNMYSQTIYTKTYITEKKGSYITEEEHYNGLGQLSCSQLPNGNVVYMRYDHQGRLIREGLPTPYSMQEYVMSNFPLDEYIEKTAPKYHNVSNPYTTIEYELGYQDRVSYSDISSFMPARNNYKLNDNYKDSFDDYRVTQFVLTDNGNLKKMGEYPKNTLRVKRTESHFLYFNYEFTNAYGQVVLTRSALETGKYDSAANEIFEHLDTYYVYDDYGNLIYVLPPEAISKGTDFSPNDPVMKNYVYSYKYDYRNRCIEKKLPGVEPIKYIYDKTDRLIFSQDGENRKKGVWLFNFQDHFGEVLLQGICKTIDSKPITNERFENGIFKIVNNNPKVLH